jgi:hypothetical protein
MSIYKDCADHLRVSYRRQTGGRLIAGHAHELVAAFFGYGSASALRTDFVHPVHRLPQADILIPDLALMDARRMQLTGLPADLPDSATLALQLCDALRDLGHFSGEEWNSRDLPDQINDYVQRDPMMIEEDLNGQISETNAYFDELYLDEVVPEPSADALMVTINGSLNGKSDEDRVFSGDKIIFTTLMTFNRVAGRVALASPELETSGYVDQSYYDE